MAAPRPRQRRATLAAAGAVWTALLPLLLLLAAGAAPSAAAQAENACPCGSVRPSGGGPAAPCYPLCRTLRLTGLSGAVQLGNATYDYAELALNGLYNMSGTCDGNGMPEYALISPKGACTACMRM